MNRLPSQRQLRVGELTRHAITNLLLRGDIHDPDLETSRITVAEVRMSPDLRIATVFVVPLGGGASDKTVKAFARNAKFIRGRVARAVNLKYAPDLRFRYDDTFDEASKIDNLLNKPVVRRDIEASDQVEAHSGTDSCDDN